MHSDFSSSRLVRLVGGWTPTPPPTGMDFAERLGLWLNAFDAIKLQAAQQAPPAPAGAAASAFRLQALRADLSERVQRVRAALAHAIAQDPVALSGADPLDPGHAPFQRRHAQLQRHMEQMLGPLREQARQSLAQASPRLKRLASLDALMQQALAVREQSLLATLPALLAQRFALAQRETALPAAQRLQAFGEEWRLALLAELDLRLEPLSGLLAALNKEANPSS